jgi:hypothetical protein
MRNRILWMMIVTSSLLWLPWSAIAADNDAVNATNDVVNQGNQILDDANRAIDRSIRRSRASSTKMLKGQLERRSAPFKISVGYSLAFNL